MTSLRDPEDIVGEESGEPWQYSIDQPPNNQARGEYKKRADKLFLALRRPLVHVFLRTTGLAWIFWQSE